MDTQPMTTSRYLQYLPGVVQEQSGDFLGQFLLAFEALLTGLDGPTRAPDEVEGLEHQLERIHTWFEPVGKGPDQPTQRAPEAFLPWLADWVAVSLRDEWTSEFKRRFIQHAVPLHRKRGTREGLKDILQLFLEGTPVEVAEDARYTHFFKVSFSARDRNPKLLALQARLVRSLIDEYKPAHTYYALAIRSPAMRISRVKPSRLTVGLNTLLGTEKLTS